MALAQLRQHPAWQVLVEEFSKKRDRYEQRLGRRLLHEIGPVDQGQLDAERAYWRAINDILAVGDKAERSLTKAIQREDDRVRS